MPISYDQINQLYQQHLGRAASQDEATNWITGTYGATDLPGIGNQIMNSGEAQAYRAQPPGGQGWLPQNPEGPGGLTGRAQQWGGILQGALGAAQQGLAGGVGGYTPLSQLGKGVTFPQVMGGGGMNYPGGSGSFNERTGQYGGWNQTVPLPESNLYPGQYGGFGAQALSPTQLAAAQQAMQGNLQGGISENRGWGSLLSGAGQAAQQALSAAGGQALMRGPDGNVQSVPAAQVAYYLARGATRIG